MATSFTDEQSRLAGIVIASLLFAAALLWFRTSGAKRARVAAAAATTSSCTAKTDDPSDVGPARAKGTDDEGDGKQQLRNVFSVKQKPIVHGSGSSAQSSSERPFESSYYFAHNKHSTGGGYKDGLRAEDYVMNGPRLLSKGGVRVNEDSNSNATPENDTSAAKDEQSESSNDAKDRPKQTKLTASTAITKYMWDDDATGNIAKIHIDSLPTKSSTAAIKWEDAGIPKENVQVRLVGESNEGLFVSVAHEGRRYHLHVPKMYGEVESVKSIVKKNKLLIKITKKRAARKRHSKRHSSEANDDGIWGAATKAIGKLAGGGGEDDADKLVLVAWPRLSASSAGGLGGGTAEIDEKLFKQLDGDGFDLPSLD